MPNILAVNRRAGSSLDDWKLFRDQRPRSQNRAGFSSHVLSYSKVALSLFLRVRAHRRPIRCGTPSRSTYTRASLSITCLSCVSACAPRECAAAGFLLRAAGPRDRSLARRDRPAGPPTPAQKRPAGGVRSAEHTAATPAPWYI